jgi:hypothetical protein
MTGGSSMGSNVTLLQEFQKIPKYEHPSISVKAYDTQPTNTNMPMGFEFMFSHFCRIYEPKLPTPPPSHGKYACSVLSSSRKCCADYLDVNGQNAKNID